MQLKDVAIRNRNESKKMKNKNLLETLLEIMLNSSESQLKAIQHTSEGIEAVLIDAHDGETYYLTLEKKLSRDC